MFHALMFIDFASAVNVRRCQTYEKHILYEDSGTTFPRFPTCSSNGGNDTKFIGLIRISFLIERDLTAQYRRQVEWARAKIEAQEDRS